MINVAMVGRLGTDVTVFDKKTKYSVFSLAVNKMKEGVTWIRVLGFGQLGENMPKFLRKGSMVFVAGTLNIGEYEGKTTLTCIASSVDVVSNNSKRSENEGQEEEETAKKPKAKAVKGKEEEVDDDLPF